MSKHIMRVIAGAVLALATSAVLVAPFGGAIVVAQGDQRFELAGRWKDTTAGFERGAGARFDGVDFVACGKQTCGVSVGADGACGAVVLKVAFIPGDAGRPGDPWWVGYVGSLTWQKRVSDARISMADGALSLTAVPKGIHPLTRLAIPVYTASYERTGVAKCAAPVS